MMTKTLISLFTKALCVILCQFCECCEDNDDCPDGVCDSLRFSIDELQTSEPEFVADKTRAMAPSFDFDWSELQATVDAFVAAIAQLMKFLGRSARVG